MLAPAGTLPGDVPVDGASLPLATQNDPAAGTPLSSRDAFTPSRLARGFFLFVVLTALGFWIVSRRGTLGPNLLETLRTVHPAALAVGCLQALLDQLLGGLRIWSCARALGTRVALWPCVLANCANVFLGGLTPSQHAGGPAQIWILMRNGMRFTEATVTSFVTYLGTVMFFLLLTIALPLIPGAHPGTVVLRAFTGGAALLFTATLCVGALALPSPGSVIGVLRAVLGSIPRFGPRLVASAGIRGLERLLLDFSLAMRRALRTGRLLLLAVIALSMLIYVNKFFVAYVVIRGLHLHPPLMETLQLQAVQALVTYFVPTPGASGVAEVTAAELMGGLVPVASLGAFIVLWRTMSLYLGMALGAIAMLASGLASAAGGSKPRSS
jgi:uncharacterized protein (TIRG00374 family)